MLFSLLDPVRQAVQIAIVHQHGDDAEPQIPVTYVERCALGGWQGQSMVSAKDRWVSSEPPVLALGLAGSRPTTSLSSPSEESSVSLFGSRFRLTSTPVAGLMHLFMYLKRSHQQSETNYDPYPGSGDVERLVNPVALEVGEDRCQTLPL